MKRLSKLLLDRILPDRNQTDRALPVRVLPGNYVQAKKSLSRCLPRPYFYPDLGAYRSILPPAIAEQN